MPIDRVAVRRLQRDFHETLHSGTAEAILRDLARLALRAEFDDLGEKIGRLGIQGEQGIGERGGIAARAQGRQGERTLGVVRGSAGRISYLVSGRHGRTRRIVRGVA